MRHVVNLLFLCFILAGCASKYEYNQPLNTAVEILFPTSSNKSQDTREVTELNHNFSGNLGHFVHPNALKEPSDALGLTSSQKIEVTELNHNFSGNLGHFVHPNALKEPSDDLGLFKSEPKIIEVTEFSPRGTTYPYHMDSYKHINEQIIINLSYESSGAIVWGGLVTLRKNGKYLYISAPAKVKDYIVYRLGLKNN